MKTTDSGRIQDCGITGRTGEAGGATAHSLLLLLKVGRQLT